MMNMNRERLYHLDFLKMCLMFTVILSHSIEVANDDWFRFGMVSVPELKFISEWFSTFHVQGFTMVSGYYSFTYMWRKKNIQILKGL